MYRLQTISCIIEHMWFRGHHPEIGKKFRLLATLSPSPLWMIQLDQWNSARPEEVEAVVQSYPVKATNFFEPRR